MHHLIYVSPLKSMRCARITTEKNHSPFNQCTIYVSPLKSMRCGTNHHRKRPFAIQSMHHLCITIEINAMRCGTNHHRKKPFAIQSMHHLCIAIEINAGWHESPPKNTIRHSINAPSMYHH
jgi:hypothetical protein